MQAAKPCPVTASRLKFYDVFSFIPIFHAGDLRLGNPPESHFIESSARPKFLLSLVSF